MGLRNLRKMPERLLPTSLNFHVPFEVDDFGYLDRNSGVSTPTGSQGVEEWLNTLSLQVLGTGLLFKGGDRS